MTRRLKMAKKMYHCEVCDKSYETEGVAIKCEQSHAQEVPCKRVDRDGNESDAICTFMLNKGIIDMNIIQQREIRPYTQRFRFNADDVEINLTSDDDAIDMTNVDEGEIDDDGHIAGV
jgi:hypothetical protein